MKIIVTGSTGFLGQNICKRLLNEGHQVVGIGRNKVIGKSLTEIGIQFYPADLRDKKLLKGAFLNSSAIIHCGAFSSPWGKWKEFYSINVLGTKNVLELSKQFKLNSFVYISSSSVYFNFADRFNIKETDNIAKTPPSLYTKSKIMAEDEVLKFKHHIDTVIIRPRGLFGPGDTAIVPRIIKANAAGKLPIIGKGNNIIDLTYIDNVVEAVILALNNASKVSGEVFNISNGAPVKLWPFIKELLNGIGEDYRPKKVPYRIIYLYAFFQEILSKYILINKEPLLTRYSCSLLAKGQTLNITKARERLGYVPIVSIQEGLRRVVADHLRSKR